MTSFDSSALQMLFTPQEYDTFTGIVNDVGSKTDVIDGIGITGSLVQQFYLPSKIDVPEMDGLQKAYMEIVNRKPRKFFPHRGSDLDIWILLKDPYNSSGVQSRLTERALDLLTWHTLNEDKTDWIKLKRKAFNEFYKQPIYYPAGWTFEAAEFKTRLVKSINGHFPHLASTIKLHFEHSFPEQFLEVRASPLATFALRPEKIGEDRTPFLYDIRDWSETHRNFISLYVSQTCNVYPFVKDGTVPGFGLTDQIGWTSQHRYYALYSRSVL